MRQAGVTVVIIILAMPFLATADDGFWTRAGGIEAFGKSHPTIRMVSEDLKITMRDERRGAKVDVTFVFRNEGPATTVTMGFPEEYEMELGGSIRHFRTSVDGHRVAAKRKIMIKGDPTKADSVETAVWLKGVAFRAHQTRKVRVAYYAWYSVTMWGGRFLEYILKTGSTWKGPIAVCSIQVKWSPFKSMSKPFVRLQAAKWTTTGHGVQVALIKNWKPTEDLLVGYRVRRPTR